MPSTLSCSRLWTISQQCTRPPRVSALSFGHGHGIQELGLGRKRSNVCIQYERQKTNSAQVCRSQAPESSGATASPGDEDEPEVIGLNKEALEEFAELNLGAWSGQFLV